MKFLEIKCGDESLKNELQIIDENNNYHYYSQLTENDSIKPKKFFVADYQCDETGYFKNNMIKAGYAILQFTYGNDTAYAYDPPYCDYYINSDNLTSTYVITESNSYYCLNTSTNDIDYTAIPTAWTSNIQIIQENHVPADEAEQLLNSFLKGGRKTLNERIHQKRVINHDRLA